MRIPAADALKALDTLESTARAPRDQVKLNESRYTGRIVGAAFFLRKYIRQQAERETDRGQP